MDDRSGKGQNLMDWYVKIHACIETLPRGASVLRKLGQKAASGFAQFRLAELREILWIAAKLRGRAEPFRRSLFPEMFFNLNGLRLDIEPCDPDPQTLRSARDSVPLVLSCEDVKNWELCPEP